MEYRKWDDTRHWHFEVEELGRDSHGRWYTGAPGIPLQRGDEAPTPEVDGFVMLVPTDGHWIAFWNRDDDAAVYVDVTDAPVVSDEAIRAIDLDLDVIVRRDGRVEVVDQDEFEEHRVALSYPDQVVADARRTAAWLEARLRVSGAPFDDSFRPWMEMAVVSWDRGQPS